ncbi:MAG: N-acetylmuramoyl-L-alanine amidase [Candidatus Eisenbacteria bacterium]
MKSTFVDLTTAHDGKHRRGTIPWEKITAVVLHQTACCLATRESRWYNLRAQIGIPSPESGPGRIYLVNPVNSLVWHAQAFSKFGVGIEINGRYEGVVGRYAKTFWRTPEERSSGVKPAPSVLTGPMIEAAREAVRYVCHEVSLHGGRVSLVLAHRQVSRTRAHDPGEAIWRSVGLWSQAELGLGAGSTSTLTGYFTDSGREIPEEWTVQRRRLDPDLESRLGLPRRG